MRGRNKPWADQFISDNQHYIYKKNEIVDKNREIYLEIGMGKGDFIIQSSKYFSDVLHFGVELNKSIFAIALKKIANEEIENLKILNVPAINLLDYFAEHSISKIFLNFSDPWPKARHEKRRLVHPKHLELFEKLLVSDGKIVFKTDNLKLFEYGLEMFKQRNYTIEFLEYDYNTIEGDFVSEYEARFRSLNQPIYRCVASIVKKED